MTHSTVSTEALELGVVPDMPSQVATSISIQKQLGASLPLMLGDTIAVGIGFVSAILIAKTSLPQSDSIIEIAIAGAVSVLLAIGMDGRYPSTIITPPAELRRLFICCTTSHLCIALTVVAVIPSESLPYDLAVIGIQYAVTLAVLLPLRVSFRAIRNRIEATRIPVHVVGTPAECRALRAWLELDHMHSLREVPWTSEASHVIGSHRVVNSTMFHGYPVRIELSLGPAQSLPSVKVTMDRLLCPMRRILKRMFDVIIVVSLMPIWVPVLLILALTVRISSPGPIFYRQQRLGYKMKVFRAWKLRSMVDQADVLLESYLDANPQLRQEWAATRKLRDDPRITAVGRFLRRSSLDELPQLWNVLRGEMSLVGPRPIPLYEEDDYSRGDSYSRVLPGLTGLWQVSGRNNTSYEDRVDMDNQYVTNWSFWLDIYILIRTVKTVALGEGAY